MMTGSYVYDARKKTTQTSPLQNGKPPSTKSVIGFKSLEEQISDTHYIIADIIVNIR